MQNAEIQFLFIYFAFSNLHDSFIIFFLAERQQVATPNSGRTNQAPFRIGSESDGVGRFRNSCSPASGLIANANYNRVAFL